MEWKIGEIKQINGEWYQCVVATYMCRGCAFSSQNYCTPNSACLSDVRSDKTSVIFKKLEKIGEPFYTGFYCSWVQKYKLYDNHAISDYSKCHFGADYVLIEIKQNKEDMEENFVKELNSLCKRYHMSDGVRADFISEVKELLKEKENAKTNLKPFNLEAAKEGKPVCTRDGREARIICFDRNYVDDDYNYPIIALIEAGENEYVYAYTEDGLISKNEENELDLMMIPEKKEGWIKVKKDVNLYATKEEADRKMIGNTDYVSAKVEWEE